MRLEIIGEINLDETKEEEFWNDFLNFLEDNGWKFTGITTPIDAN